MAKIIMFLVLPTFLHAMNPKLFEFSQATLHTQSKIEKATDFCQRHRRTLVAIIDDSKMDRKVMSHFIIANKSKEHAVITFNSGVMFLKALNNMTSREY